MHWRTEKTGLREALISLFSDRDGEVIGYQLEETRTVLPILAAFHLYATIAVAGLAFVSIPVFHLAPWIAASLFVETMILLSYFALGQAGRTRKKAKQVLIFGPFAGLALNLVWGWAVMVISPSTSFLARDLIELLAMVTIFVALLCTVRLPATSLQFVLAPVAFLVAHAIQLEGGSGLYTLFIGLGAAVAVVSVMLILSFGFRRRIIIERSMKHDAEVIKLLLHDFGDEIRDWMWETDRQGQLTFHSPKLAELLGAPQHNFVGTDFVENFILRFSPELAQRLAARETISDALIETHGADGIKHWRFSAKPLDDAEGHFDGYRGVTRDVTLQRKQELEIADARDEAQRALETRAQFLAVMSHELRTPINAIVGFSEVMSAAQADRLPLSARREYLATILESARHLQGLINDVLETTRMERGDVQLHEQPNDMAELIEVTVKIVRDNAMQQGISMIAEVVDDVEVTGDLTRLKQVVLNLLTNAIKFSSRGSTVRIDMRRDSAHNLVISVKDTGIGISPENARRVFEPFVQVDNGSNRRFGGMGLGLSIARKVARLHGGDLVLDGQVGVGTEARLTLPASRVRWPKSKLGPSSHVAA